MSDEGFSWFPNNLSDENRVLIFIDAKIGCILNLDGSIKGDSQGSKESFSKVFDDRTSALEWAKKFTPKEREVLCLLYDKNHEEEYVTLDLQTVRIDNNVFRSFLNKIFRPKGQGT